MIRSLALTLTLFLTLALHSAAADLINSQDQAEFQRIITAQISAFRADDGAAAYEFAAPVVRKFFPTVEVFMAMVKNGYPQVYRPQSFIFNEALTDPQGRPAQKVTILGPDGKTYMAIYTLEKQADGKWLISSCTILLIPGLDA
jgi:hypothetical protein